MREAEAATNRLTEDAARIAAEGEAARRALAEAEQRARRLALRLGEAQAEYNKIAASLIPPERVAAAEAERVAAEAALLAAREAVTRAEAAPRRRKAVSAAARAASAAVTASRAASKAASAAARSASAAATRSGGIRLAAILLYSAWPRRAARPPGARAARLPPEPACGFPLGGDARGILGRAIGGGFGLAHRLQRRILGLLRPLPARQGRRRPRPAAGPAPPPAGPARPAHPRPVSAHGHGRGSAHRAAFWLPSARRGRGFPPRRIARWRCARAPASVRACASVLAQGRQRGFGLRGAGGGLLRRQWRLPPPASRQQRRRPARRRAPATAKARWIASSSASAARILPGEVAVPAGLARLALQLRQPGFDLALQIVGAGEILLGRLEFQLRLMPAGMQAGNAGGLLQQAPGAHPAGHSPARRPGPG